MKLFETGKIGCMELKNRIVMAPMGVRGLSELDGRFSERGIEYFTTRARGGVGLIITGSVQLHVVESHLVNGMWSFRPRMDSMLYAARLNEMANELHHYGTKIAAQLTPGFGRVGGLTVSTQPISASAVPYFWNPAVTCRELTQDEINQIIKAMGNAAKVVKTAEFDAIELHGHEGYLLDQFQTALWNKRTDKYGGSFDNRMRFPMELIAEVRQAVGPNFPIIYCFGAKHYLEGGREVEESQKMARYFEAAGIDALQVDAGSYETWYWAHPPVYMPAGCMVDCAEAIKKVVKIPVIAVGKLGNPKVAEQVLQDGKADFIGIGRPLIADPDWPNKVKEGKVEDIRPCIGDQDGCLHRVVAHNLSIGCSVNAQVGKEREYAIVPAAKPKKVLVVGSGPAGLEAARVAALRGHRVTIWEMNDKIGGNLLAAGAPPFKLEERDLIQYFSVQMEKLGVNVEFGRKATVSAITKMKPDAVVLATGALPLIPPIAGIKGKNVVTAIDLLVGKTQVGERVIIVGGGIAGCETAVHLARQGKKVTVVEMCPNLLPEEMDMANRQMLLIMIKESGVTALTGACLCGVDPKGVTVEINKTKKDISGDSVVLAIGLVSQSQLQQELKDTPFAVQAVGDCVKPRRILNAVWEGFHAARLI